ncbi:uncharacterized protein UV8b_01684 [Ustilaginoidea virens]|uniref:Uncharacterized protein n=1 Tax=Ustilaginoidea virens TaxID=1159556 RepID=A0A8E5HLF7_USTVR|nr:uncharacterized protein UV8b_01684 [Ustilaginoidea virens]QUC17443.1 hypothetical protein UV8b_01684 [Ustilaginoidea virens]
MGLVFSYLAYYQVGLGLAPANSQQPTGQGFIPIIPISSLVIALIYSTPLSVPQGVPTPQPKHYARLCQNHSSIDWSCAPATHSSRWAVICKSHLES